MTLSLEKNHAGTRKGYDEEFWVSGSFLISIWCLIDEGICNMDTNLTSGELRD